MIVNLDLSEWGCAVRAERVIDAMHTESIRLTLSGSEDGEVTVYLNPETAAAIIEALTAPA
jgi:hypothetical protein